MFLFFGPESYYRLKKWVWLISPTLQRTALSPTKDLILKGGGYSLKIADTVETNVTSKQHKWKVRNAKASSMNAMFLNFRIFIDRKWSLRVNITKGEMITQVK